MTKLVLSPPHPDGIDEIDFDDAVQRVVSYCCTAKSGWHTYDRPSHAARKEGVFDSLSPWSLLWAEALNGQIKATNMLEFTAERRGEYARSIQRIGRQPLADLDEEATNELAVLCSSGFKGVWAAKLTKVLALYLPAAMPVLDREIARSLGLGGTSFRPGISVVGRGRAVKNIGAAVRSLQSVLHGNAETLGAIRMAITEEVDDFGQASDVRMLDIILWTSQVDRGKVGRGADRSWRDRDAGPYIAPDLASTLLTP